MLASCVVDRGFKPKIIKLVFVASLLRHNINEEEQRLVSSDQDNMSEWSNMLCQWTSTIKFNKTCWSSTKWTSLLSYQNVTYSRCDMAEKLLLYLEIMMPSMRCFLACTFTTITSEIWKKYLTWRHCADILRGVKYDSMLKTHHSLPAYAYIQTFLL